MPEIELKKVSIKILTEILSKMSPLAYNQEIKKVGEVQNVLNHLSNLMMGWLRKGTFSKNKCLVNNFAVE